jgi:hypothetical protein
MTALADRLPEVLLSGLLQLLQDHRGDFGGRILLAARLDPHVAVARAHDRVGHHLHLFVDFVVLPAHEPLDREHGVLRVRHGLALGHLPTSRSPDLVNPTTDGVMRLPSGLVMTTGSPPSITATRSSSSQVDADNLAHVVCPRLRKLYNHSKYKM